MERNSEIYQTYVEILERELVSAMGCTEPIAIAYCAAKARSVLGEIPDKVTIFASGNIIKNVKSVVVPNTEGRRGIKVAAAAGIIGGNENGGLLVIADIPPGVKYHIEPYLEQADMQVNALDSESLLEVEIIVQKDDESAKVHIVDEHTNIVSIEKNGEVIFEKQEGAEVAADDTPDYNLLTVADIKIGRAHV